MEEYDYGLNSPFISPHRNNCNPATGRCVSATGSRYHKMQQRVPTRSPSWPYLHAPRAMGAGEVSPSFPAPLNSYRPFPAFTTLPTLSPTPPVPPTAPALPLRRLYDSQLNLRYGSSQWLQGSRFVGRCCPMGDAYDSSLEYDLLEGESHPCPFDVPYRPPTRGRYQSPQEEPYVTTMCPSSHSTFDCTCGSYNTLPRKPYDTNASWGNCFPLIWPCESQVSCPFCPPPEWPNYLPITTQDTHMGIRAGQSQLKRYSEPGPITPQQPVYQMRFVPEIWNRDTTTTEAPAKKPRKQWNAIRPPQENPQLKSPNQLVVPDHLIDRRSSFWPPGELFLQLKQLGTQRSLLGSLDRIQEVPGDRREEDPQNRLQGGAQTESPGSWFPSDESMEGLADRPRINPKSLQDRLLDIAESENSLDPKDATETSSTEGLQKNTECECLPEPQKQSSARSIDVVRPNKSRDEPPNKSEPRCVPGNESPCEQGGGSLSEPQLGGQNGLHIGRQGPLTRFDPSLEKRPARSLSCSFHPSEESFCNASRDCERRGPQGSRIVRGARMQHRFLPNWLFFALERAPEVLQAAVDFYFDHMRWPPFEDQPTRFRDSIPASARPRDLRESPGGFAPAWTFALRRLAEGGLVDAELLPQALANFFARGVFPPLALYPPALLLACQHLRLGEDHFYALDL